MGLRFRQSFTLFPGVRLNLGKRGMSASFGVPGATLNLSGRGVRATVGVPGSGMSYSTVLAPSGAGGQPVEPAYWQPPPQASPTTVPGSAPSREAYVRAAGMREIGSAAVESLTSDGLLPFRSMIVDAGRQRGEIESDLSEAGVEHAARNGELGRKKKSLFRVFFKKRIAELEEVVPNLAAEIERLETWLEATHIEVQFDSDDAAQRAYAALVRAYDTLRTSVFVWDVTSDRDANRVAERTTATRVLDRRPVKFDYAKSDLIRFNGRALEHDITAHCGADAAIYARNKNRGGRNNTQGASYEAQFGAMRAAEALADALRTGDDGRTTWLEEQRLCFVDDLIIDSPGNRRLSQLKSGAVSWSGGKHPVADDFRLQAKLDAALGVAASYELVVSDSDLRSALAADRPDDLTVDVVRFARTDDLDKLFDEHPHWEARTDWPRKGRT